MNNPPGDLAEALARAKTYQAITKPSNPVKSLYQQIREENVQTSAAIFDQNQQAINRKLEKKMDEIVKQLGILSAQIPTLQRTEQNIPCHIPQMPTPFFPPFPLVPFNEQLNPLPVTTNNIPDSQYQNQDDNNNRRDNNNCNNNNRNNYNNRNNNNNKGNNTNNRNNYNNRNNNNRGNNNRNNGKNNNHDNNITPHCNTIDESKRPQLPAREHIINYNPKTMSSNAHINGKVCKILFDTGSEVTLMTKRYFDSLNLGHLLRNPRCNSIKAVDSNTISVIGQITVPIHINDFETEVTFQIVPDIHVDIIFGRDMMNTHIKGIDYENSLITFRDISPNCCELVIDDKIILKGFLQEDIEILPNTEKEGFLKTEAIFSQTRFQLKGLISLTAEKNIIVHDDNNVTTTSQGIPFKISNFTNDTVHLSSGV